MTQLHHLTAAEQLHVLRGREVSSTELTQHYLSRIEEHGKALGAFVSVFADEALAAARKADQVAGGLALHGLPLALKDLHPTAGMRTTMGSAALESWVPDFDAPAVGALRAAGAVIVGKTNAPEFGPVCYTETIVAGDAETPYRQGFSASGSSGGAAAAVAAGLIPVGHASDGLGSIRTPAANCGLVGVKPSRGRIVGCGTDWIQLAVEGPVARTVGDAALLLEVMRAGQGELWRGPTQEPGSFVRAAAAGVERPLRIGRILDPGFDTPVDNECRTAWEGASATLEQLGHVVEDVPAHLVPRTAELEDPLLMLVAVRIGIAVDTLVPPAHRDRLLPFTRWLHQQAPQYSASELAIAQSRLAALSGSWLRLQESYDLLLTPTTAAPPQRTGGLRLDDGLESGRAMLSWTAFTPWANLTGSAAITLPVHTTDVTLPVGVQLMTAPHQDELLFGVAAQMEEVYRWQDRHPPQW